MLPAAGPPIRLRDRRYVPYRREVRRQVHAVIVGAAPRWIGALTDAVVSLAVAYELPFDVYGLGGDMGSLVLQRVVGVPKSRCACRRRCSCRAGLRVAAAAAAAAAPEWRAWAQTPEHYLVAARYPTNIVKAAGRVYMANAASLYVMAAASESERAEEKANCGGEVSVGGGGGVGASPTCNCVVTEESVTNEDEPPNGSGWRLVSRYPWAFYSPVPVVVRNRWIWFLSGHSQPSPDLTDTSGTLVYDTLTCAWRAGPWLDVGRCAAVAAVLGPCLCVFGGQNTESGFQSDGIVLDCGEDVRPGGLPEEAVRPGGLPEKEGGGWRKLPTPPFPTPAEHWYSAAYEVDNGLLRLVCENGSAYDLALEPTDRHSDIDSRRVGSSDGCSSGRPSGLTSSPPSGGNHLGSFETKDSLTAVWKPAPPAIPQCVAGFGRVMYFFDVASGVHVAFATDHTATVSGNSIGARPLRVWMCSGEKGAQWVKPRLLGNKLFNGVCLIRHDLPSPPDKGV